MTFSGYEGLRILYGDLHSHCGEVGYGHGSLQDAMANARLQLDFASVTAHAHWPDMPPSRGFMAQVNAYHIEGFRRAAESWQTLEDISEAACEEGRFVAFPSFEWHSMRYGDHHVVFRSPGGHIVRADSLDEMRAELRRLAGNGIRSFLIPHHIGYLSGFRGVSWEDFTPEFSPVAEIMSMHGCAESDTAPFPYLHGMGPQDGRGTMQHGLGLGHVFGVVGSTDHHSAHPGSYGHGRMAVWAEALTREAVWQAIAARRTVALTGDRIKLAFTVDGAPMGSMLGSRRGERQIEVDVTGGAAIDYVEVLCNNSPIFRRSAHEVVTMPSSRFRIALEVGWGDKESTADWEVQLEVHGGRLLGIEPRFRGRDIVAPQTGVGDHVFSNWEWRDNALGFRTKTWGNPTTVTPATQGVCLEIEGDERTHISGRINGAAVALALGELREGALAGYPAGYLTPAYRFGRAVSPAEYQWRFALTHTGPGESEWYYVRVCQKNGQWAWSSPIWLGASAALSP